MWWEVGGNQFFSIRGGGQLWKMVWMRKLIRGAAAKQLNKSLVCQLLVWNCPKM